MGDGRGGEGRGERERERSGGKGGEGRGGEGEVMRDSTNLGPPVSPTPPNLQGRVEQSAEERALHLLDDLSPRFLGIMLRHHRRHAIHIEGVLPACTVGAGGWCGRGHASR